MKLLLRFGYGLVVLAVAAAFGLGMAVIGAYYYVAPSLPEVETLREVQLQIPMRVYTRDGRLMAEFGEQRRIPVDASDVPDAVRSAFLAAEDDRFFEHPGVDWQGFARAAYQVALTGEPRQGGSTITMQVARNFFLSFEKTIARKVREIFLAVRIEQALSKNEILTLYMNKIFLGQRAYGVGAAAEVYFGKPVEALSIAEAATIAGLARAPSLDNPVASPDRALARRAYVLRRMREIGAITPEELEAASAEPMMSRLHGPTVEVNAPWLAEMVRQEMIEQFGPEAYTAGYEVVTTVDSRLQPLAQAAVREGLRLYDRRHGYRGPVAKLDAIPAEPAQLEQLLAEYPEPADLRIALVRSVEEGSARMAMRGGVDVEVPMAGMEWARPYLDDNRRGPAPESPAQVVSPGDLVYLLPDGDSWQLAQVPDVQGAMVVLDPHDGAIAALVGGLDFETSKFNRAVQARRQPGSAFKPFIYSAALNHGFTPATVVNDAPVVLDDPALETTWRPKNYGGSFYGPMRLREALVKSRNLVSIRVLNDVGLSPTLEHVRAFGFDADALPRNLTLALGSGNVTPLELATGYAAFANGGFRVEPYFLDRILGPEGDVLFQADPAWACDACAIEDMLEGGDGQPDESDGAELAELEHLQPPRAVDPANAWLISDMLHDVTVRGTGARARALGRGDLAGKTGTTNEGRDTWFSGFTSDLVATAWVGFDQERSLGRGETGASTALPSWMAFMGPALEGLPEQRPAEPPGLVTVRISSDSGLLARAGDPEAIFETFRVGQVPTADTGGPAELPEEEQAEEEPLF
ncbi:MAG: penicillin-binding protein 1A [Gammaproteobacteria bacterium]